MSARRVQSARGKAGFLAQFTLGGFQSVLARRVQLARGNFQHHAAYRGAVLVNHGNISVLVYRHDSHRADVARDFAQRRAAVGQAHLPVLYMQKRAVEYLFAAQLVLDHILSIHIKPPNELSSTGHCTPCPP